MTPETAIETLTPVWRASQAPLAFTRLWYASGRRHTNVTTRAVAAVPAVADAGEVA